MTMSSRLAVCVVWFFCLFGIPDGTADAGAYNSGISVLVSTDSLGEACADCSPDSELVGLARRAALIDQLRTAEPNVVLVDGGNVLFRADTISSGGAIMLTAYAQLGYQAVNLAYRDFRLGKQATVALIEEGVIDLVSANLVNADTGKLLAEPYVVSEGSDGNIAILGVTQSPAGLAYLPHLQEQLAGVHIEPPEEAVAKWLPRAKADADRVVLLYYGSYAGLKPIYERFGDELDAILVGGTRPDYLPKETVPPIVGTSDRGQHLALVEIHGQGPAADVRVTQIPVDESIPPDPEMQELIAQYLPDDGAAVIVDADVGPGPEAEEQLAFKPVTRDNGAVRVRVRGAETATALDEERASEGKLFLVLDTRWENLRRGSTRGLPGAGGGPGLGAGAGGLGMGMGAPAGGGEARSDKSYRLARPLDQLFLRIGGLAFRLHPATEAGPDALALQEALLLAKAGDVRSVRLVFVVPKDASDIALEVRDPQRGDIVLPVRGDLDQALGAGEPMQGIATAETSFADVALRRIAVQASYLDSPAPAGWHYAVASLGIRAASADRGADEVVLLDPSTASWATTPEGYIYYPTGSATAIDGSLRLVPGVPHYQELAFAVPAEARALGVGLRLGNRVTRLAPTGQGWDVIPTPISRHRDGDVAEILLLGERDAGSRRVLDIALRSLIDQGLEVQGRQFQLTANGATLFPDAEATAELLHRPPSPFLVPPNQLVRFELAYDTNAAPQVLHYQGFASAADLALTEEELPDQAMAAGDGGPQGGTVQVSADRSPGEASRDAQMPVVDTAPLGESEPNDKLEQANALPLGRTVEGYMEGSWYDWYRLDVPPSPKDLLRGDLTGIPGVNLRLHLHDATGEALINVSATGDGGPETLIDVGVTSGTYFLVVTSDSGTNPDVAYTLTADLTGTQLEGHERELNDEPRSANTVVLAVPVTGRFQWPHDRDWYRLEVTDDGISRLRMELSGVPDVDSILALHAAGGDLLKEINIAEEGKPETLMDIGVTKGTYLIRVEAKWGWHPEASYRLLAERLGPWSPGLELEPNDTREQSNPIESATPIRGLFQTPGDEDWYRLRLRDEGERTLSVELSGVPGVDARLALHDAAGDELVEVDEGYDGESENLVWPAAADQIYYIVPRIRHYGDPNRDPAAGYSLEVRVAGYDDIQNGDADRVGRDPSEGAAAIEAVQAQATTAELAARQDQEDKRHAREPLAGERIFTTDADFDEGFIFNLHHEAPNNDQLQLERIPRPFPYVNVAASDRGTVVRIDTRDGRIVGEYRTAPEGRLRDPSRTTVDLLGNVWAGNRAEDVDDRGSVVKVGLVIGGARVDSSGAPDAQGAFLSPPFLYNTCVDRDRDGFIKTSRGLGDILPWPHLTDGSGGDTALVEEAEDECILVYQRTPGVVIRHVSVDSHNDVWVGGYPNEPHLFDKLDGDSGERLEGFSAEAIGCGGYGGLIDGNNVLWSASKWEDLLLRYDLTAKEGQCIPVHTSYGLSLDSKGFLWNSDHDWCEIVKLSPAGKIQPGFPKQIGPWMSVKGVAVTYTDDNVWIAHDGGSHVSRLDNQGDLLKVIEVGEEPTGVAVDHDGKVWVTNMKSDSVSRIDTLGGQDGLGAVDLTVNLGPGAEPYNYSDMTGAVVVGVTAGQGMWSLFYDTGIPGDEETTIRWNTEPEGFVPDGGAIDVEVRGAKTIGELTTATYRSVENGNPLRLAGPYLEVRTTLKKDGRGLSPVLSDLSILRKGGVGQLSVQLGEESVAMSPRVELILDASGSMRERRRLIEGRLKIDVAKEVLSEIVSSLPTGSEVALRTYGRRVREGRPGDCQDTELLVPFGPLNQERMLTQVRGIRALGTTPLTYSLLQAATDFPQDARPKHIVLITDGKEECGGNPVSAVAALQGRGIDVRVDVVGFALADPQTKRDMQEVAVMTGGTFFDAQDRQGLRDALRSGVVIPFDVLDSAGQRVADGRVGETIELPVGDYTVRAQLGPITSEISGVSIRHDELTEVRLELGAQSR